MLQDGVGAADSSAALVNRAGYNRWSQIYDEGVNSTVAVDEMHFPALYSKVSQSRVLEVGCGTGRHTLRLAQQGNEVTAIDLSPGMLAVARQKLVELDAHRVKLIEADFMNADLGFTEEFDASLTALVLEHIERLDIFFGLVSRALKPGGLLFVSEIHPDRIAAGTSAFFTDANSGETVRLCSFAHPAAVIESHALAAGLHLQHRSDVVGGDDLVALHADWKRHIGRLMIRMWKFQKVS